MPSILSDMLTLFFSKYPLISGVDWNGTNKLQLDVKSKHFKELTAVQAKALQLDAVLVQQSFMILYKDIPIYYASNL